jgi:hypothetical protein
MSWFSVKKENLFHKYPDVELTADAFDPIYKVKYTECVKDGGTIRFDRKEKTVPKEKVERLLAELLDG